MKNNLILVNSLSDGGAEKVVKTLIEKLHLEDINIELVCLENNHSYEVNSEIKVSYLSDFTGSESALKKLLYIPLLSFRLMQYVHKNKINLVQSHLFRASYINLISKILFHSNHIVQVVNHSVISRYLKEGLSGKVNLYLIKLLYPYADKIISVSNIVENDMQKVFSFQNEMEVIHNPIDIQKIQNLSQDSIADFNFNSNKKYLISVGRLIKLKRNADLLYILSKLDNHVEVIFIGDGPEKENLIYLSNELNLSDKVHFIGWVNNPYKYMKKSNILISTSETESFGNTIIEAMACGVPVVSSKSGGPDEIIENKSIGVLIEIGDIDTFVLAIEKLLTNKIEREKLIRNSLFRIKKFDVKHIIEQYKKVLKIE